MSNYISKNGAVIEVNEYKYSDLRKKGRYYVRFNTTSMCWYGFKNKLKAIIFASHKLGLSGENARWNILK